MSRRHPYFWCKRVKHIRSKLYRRQVMQGAQYIHCHYCGTHLTPMTATVDHVIPRSKGGTSELSNLVLACRKCNQAKGNKMPEQFHPKQAA